MHTRDMCTQHELCERYRLHATPVACHPGWCLVALVALHQTALQAQGSACACSHELGEPRSTIRAWVHGQNNLACMSSTPELSCIRPVPVLRVQCAGAAHVRAGREKEQSRSCDAASRPQRQRGVHCSHLQGRLLGALVCQQCAVYRFSSTAGVYL